MKNLLRLEELAQFLVCVFALYVLDVSWWVYILLVIGPDIAMLGYLVDTRAGAIAYNVLHHKGLAVLFIAIGLSLGWTINLTLSIVLFGQIWVVAGIILYGHASMDRIFGYGLKFGDNFHRTHLGWIGGKKVEGGESKIGL